MRMYEEEGRKVVKNFFSGNAWSGTKAAPGGSLSGMGFRPGAVEVNLVRPLVGAPPTFGAPARQLSQPRRSTEEVTYSPSPIPMPSGNLERKVNQGKKADCPVCRKFGS